METVTFNDWQSRRVEVNLNAVASDGTIRVGLEIGDAELAPGAHVAIYDPDDEVEGTAVVARVNEAARLAYLDVHWQSLRELQLAQMIAVVSATSAQLEPTTPFAPRLVTVGR